MPKAEKSVVSHRVNEVLRLIVAGAEFMDISRYAQEHGWKISERQVRRYMGRAHKLFAKSTQKNRRQLLGRHLVQRRSIYARAVKSGDLRTALQALKDEAELQGLYPGSDIKGETPEERTRRILGPVIRPALTRAVRTARLLNAQATGDCTEQALIEETSPKVLYYVKDTQFPVQMLHTLALMYVAEQLDHAGMVMHMTLSALTKSSNSDETLEEHLQFCDYAVALHAYLFKIGKEGWELFCQEIGVDGSYLLSENHRGLVLELITERICGLAPSAEQLKKTLLERGDDMGSLVTAPDLARSWQRMFTKATREIDT